MRLLNGADRTDFMDDRDTMDPSPASPVHCIHPRSSLDLILLEFGRRKT